MQTALRLLIALVSAVITTSVLASIISSQFVITGLQDVSVLIPMSDRLSMTISDLAILKLLCPIVAICFLVGFIVASLATKHLGGKLLAWQIAAGFCALIATLIVLSVVFQLAPVAGARTPVGLFCMGLAGAAGGWVFARMSRIKG